MIFNDGLHTNSRLLLQDDMIAMLLWYILLLACSEVLKGSHAIPVS